MGTSFIKLTQPTSDHVRAFTRWENDPELIHLTQRHQNQEELESAKEVTLTGLTKRLEDHDIYLIYSDEQLVGEINFMLNPEHLYIKDSNSAWIGITIGEPEGRGKGIGVEAIHYIEEQLKQQGIKRVELGVFEFNKPAHKLYQKLGYKEITRLENVTYWNGKMWKDIRMEKYINEN